MQDLIRSAYCAAPTRPNAYDWSNHIPPEADITRSTTNGNAGWYWPYYLPEGDLTMSPASFKNTPLWSTYGYSEPRLPPSDYVDHLRQRENSSVSSEGLSCGSDPARCLLRSPARLTSNWRNTAPSLPPFVSSSTVTWPHPRWSPPDHAHSVNEVPVSDLNYLLRYNEAGPPLIPGAEWQQSHVVHSHASSKLVPNEGSYCHVPFPTQPGELLAVTNYPHSQNELMSPLYGQNFHYHRRYDDTEQCPVRMPRTQTFGDEQKAADKWSASDNSNLWGDMTPFPDRKHLVSPGQCFPQLARRPPQSPAPQSPHKRQKTSTSRRLRCVDTNSNPSAPQCSTLASDLEVFAVQFKQRRMKLGITQADVGKALGRLNIPGLEGLSQSTICRFESLTLSHTNMQNLQPILQLWLDMAAEEFAPTAGASSMPPSRALTGQQHQQQPTASSCPTNAGASKRRRACITDSERRSLEAYFAVQPQPSGEQLAQISVRLGLKRRVVRVWFCNQRQKQKRLKFLSGGPSAGAGKEQAQQQQWQESHSESQFPHIC